MKPTVYIETSVVSYLAAKSSRDLIVAGHQQVTEDWWRNVLPEIAAFVSELVLEEAGKGDIEAAARRLAQLSRGNAEFRPKVADFRRKSLIHGEGLRA